MSSLGNNNSRKNEPRRVSGGKRRMQSYCLRYAMGVMEKQAQEIHREAKDPSKRQKLQQQTEEIIAKVRRRINDESVPPEYLKAEDPCVENMEQLNRQRQAEIDTNEKMLATLQKQVKQKEKEIRKASKVKEARNKKLDNLVVVQCHVNEEYQDIENEGQQEDLLAAFHNDDGTFAHKDEVPPPSLSELTYHRAPKGTMAKFLEAMSS